MYALLLQKLPKVNGAHLTQLFGPLSPDAMAYLNPSSRTVDNSMQKVIEFLDFVVLLKRWLKLETLR